MNVICIAPSPSKTVQSKESNKRINITISIPELNQSFMVNQPSDGCSALLILCIRRKLTVRVEMLALTIVELARERKAASLHIFQ